MGGKQSALKKEIAALQQEARKRSGKHQAELDAAAKEKRQLQAKIDGLQAIVTQAQEEADKAKHEAREREERMKALKWELVRQLRLTGSPASPSSRASLSPSPSRVALNWRLNDDVSLRQSVVSRKKTSESPTTAPTLNDTTISSNNTPTPSLLAPRRSLLKRPEALSGPEPTSLAPSPNQAADADVKETFKPSETASKPTPTTSSPPESTSSNDDAPSKQDDDDAKVVSKSSDDSAPNDFKIKDSSSKTHFHIAESKDCEDDNPETNDIRS